MAIKQPPQGFYYFSKIPFSQNFSCVFFRMRSWHFPDFLSLFLLVFHVFILRLHASQTLLSRLASFIRNNRRRMNKNNLSRRRKAFAGKSANEFFIIRGNATRKPEFARKLLGWVFPRKFYSHILFLSCRPFKKKLKPKIHSSRVFKKAKVSTITSQQ